MKEKYIEKFMKQKMMRGVLLVLLPIILISIYFFGIRVLLLYSLIIVSAALTENIFVRKRKGKISEAVFVSSILYTMTLPPSTPYWIAVVGIVFGIIFSKEVFGGFGKNIFNPALAGRAFVYVNFPAQLTIVWNKVIIGGIGGFGKYLGGEIEAVSQATPMLLFRDTGMKVSFKELLFGNVSGAIGETCAILIIFAGIYLIYKKLASKEIIFSSILGFVSLSFILRLLGNENIPNPIYGMLIGGFLFGSVFMATDPITAPKNKKGKYLYGFLIGIITVIIRAYALFAGGMMFAILIMNCFSPIIDELFKWLANRKVDKEEVVI